LQSAYNKRPRRDGRSGITWVRQRPSRRWEARVQRNGTKHYFGTFDTPEEAANACAAYLDDLTADAACEEAFERMRWHKLESEIFFAQHAEYMMNLAA
jgi:hypothetical protein